VTLRLLLVIDEVTLGGAELSFLELCRSLAMRCEVHLALSERSLRNPAIAVLTSPAIAAATLHPCSSPLYPGTIANLHPRLRQRPAREVARLLARIRPACVIVNLPTVERGQAVIDAARLTSPPPPVWGFLHLVQRPSTIGAKFGLFRDRMIKRLIRRFDRLLTVSHDGARQISLRYRMGLPDVIHPPTSPLQPADPVERARRRAGENLPDGFLLGMVGRVQLRQKGHDAALRLVSRLTEAGRPLRLTVIGDGPDLPAVRRLAERLGVSAQISFLGWRQDAGALIPLLDAVLLPSHFEGLPQTALQAASARVPVIAYQVDGLREFLPPAFQVPYADEKSLAAAVRGLMEGTLSWPAEEMATRARTWGNPALAAERLLALLRADLQVEQARASF
jgi:glycosyltransferase involved in cell wall biosynthesis